MKSLFKNLGYQTLYQILTICLPLFTSPYISRVLGVSGLGVYSYTYSVVNYFVIFSMLGVANYGSKTIAKVKNDKTERTKLFWSIYMLQWCVSLLCLLSYVTFIFVSKPEHFQIALLQGIWIVGCIFDVSWFFFGIENFKIAVIRNGIVKILTVMCIFIFVQTSNDVWIYTIIMPFGTLISQLTLWPFLRKYVGIYKPSIHDVAAHIKPNFLLFVPLLAMSVYHTMDKTMLGIFSSYDEVGYYYNADKVMSIPLSAIMATGTVMLPRMAYLSAEGKKDESYSLFALTLELFMAVTIAMSFGISAVAKEFIPLFFGPGYERCIELVYLFAVIMCFKSLSSIIRNQYLIPNEQEKVYTFSVIVGAFINFIANTAFIYFWNMGAVGATIATLIAEVVTCTFYVIFAQRRMNVWNPIRRSIFYFIPGICMFLAVRVIRILKINIIVLIATQVLIGAGIFLGICWFYWKLYLRKKRGGDFIYGK